MFRNRGDVVFWLAIAAVFLAGVAATRVVHNEYYFTAVYAILQATIMAVAWNILGGFTGYVNFGSAAFFAIGAYTAVALDKWLGLRITSDNVCYTKLLRDRSTEP